MMEKNNTRDYNKEPIVIKNDYLLQSELTGKILMFLLFAWGISINITPEIDSGNELYRRLALGATTLGMVVTIFGGNKFLFALFKNDLFITIKKNEISYEYITKNGIIKTLEIFENEIDTVKWSIVPIFGEYSKITKSLKTLNDKFEYYIFLIPRFILNLIFVFCFFIIKFLKIKQYYIFTTKNNYIFAIPKNKELEEMLFKQVSGFSKITLTDSLLIKNSKILTGE